MQFSPDKTERYAAALRNHIQKTRSKGKNLRKIIVFELLYNKLSPEPTDIKNFCDIIFTAAQIELIRKRCPVATEILGDEIKNIDRKALAFILFECLLSASKCEHGKTAVKLTASEIIIKVRGRKLSAEVIKTAKRSGFICFYMKSTKTTALKGEFESFAKTLPIRENVWDYLLNPYSLLHIIL